MKNRKTIIKRPIAADLPINESKPAKVEYGTAVIPFDENKGCWFLPSGVNQKNREIWSRTEALHYAKVIDAFICRWLQYERTTQRGGV